MSKCFHLLVAACVLLIFIFGEPRAPLADYRVASGDKLKVTVFQWPEYSGESQVDDIGNISLQAVGRIPATGHTVAEIETMVKDKISLVSGNQPLEVVVEVIEYRPFSILGAVKLPGRYPYVVNTTVLDAVATAGGFLRPGQADNFDQHRNLINAKERLQVLKIDRLVALARRARLIAEQNDLSEIEFPDEVLEFRKTPTGRWAVAQEVRIFDLNDQAKNRIEVHNPDQNSIHQDEIRALRRHANAIDQTMKFLEEELKKRSELLDKGFARTIQVVDMRSEILDLKTERRRTILDTTRAKREILKANHTAYLLDNERKREIAESLSEVEAQIATLDQQIETQEAFLKAMGVAPTESAPTTQLESSEDEESFHYFSIIRNTSEGEQAKSRTQVSGNTRINPGDIVVVDLR